MCEVGIYSHDEYKLMILQDSKRLVSFIQDTYHSHWGIESTNNRHKDIDNFLHSFLKIKNGKTPALVDRNELIQTYF